MKKTLAIVMALTVTAGLSAAKRQDVTPRSLQFDVTKGVVQTMETVRGKTICFTAYEGLFYVANVEDSTYQTLNVYVPEGATQQTPIFLRTYVGGYMASRAQAPQAGDATGRALEEGYVVVIPGTRGRNSTVTADKAYAKAHRGVRVGQTIYTGRAPKAILDLKAAIRYLRHFDKEMPGDAEQIITDGTSAGGAMSALMGGTGNHPDYEPLLDAMGAAKERDDVFASVCFCPITDLDHADMAYEWLYDVTNTGKRSISEAQKPVSDELAALYPEYINSLGLKKPDGTLLTADNYLDYIKELLIHSAQIAKNAGAEIPDSIGFKFNESKMRMGTMAPINGGTHPRPLPLGEGSGHPQGMKQVQGLSTPLPHREGRGGGSEYIIDLDMPTYLNYVVTTQPLKSAPAFDSKGVADCSASGENEEFGDETGSSVNFTDFSAQQAGTALTDEIRRNVHLMNPMNYIGNPQTSVASHWYIRHGSRDRDTSFPVPVNLATKLQNMGKDVNFLLAWNRPHSGDYALDELFDWIREITK